MKLKFIKVRDNHVFAVPESQYRGLLLMKKRFSKEQMTKMGPIFQYMFHDLEGHTAVVKDKHFYKMMDWNIKLKGPRKNFAAHIETAARACTKADPFDGDWGSDNEDFGDEESDNGSVTDGDDDYDEEVDEGEADDLVRLSGEQPNMGPGYFMRQRRQRSPSPTPRAENRLTVYEELKDSVVEGMQDDGIHMVNFEEDGVVVTIASNYSCMSILTLIIICSVAVAMSLNGMETFWDKWSAEGGTLPSAEAVTSIVVEPYNAHYKPQQVIWYGLPEYEKTLEKFSGNLGFETDEFSMIAHMEASEILEIYGGKVSGNKQLESEVKQYVSEKMLDAPIEEQLAIQKAIFVLISGKSPKAPKGSGLMRYGKAYVQIHASDLIYGGALYVISSMEFEDIERAFLFMVNTGKLGLQAACGYLLADLPPEVVSDPKLLSQVLTRLSGVFVPEFAVDYMMKNTEALYKYGKELMDDPTSIGFIKNARELLKYDYNDKKNIIKPAINRMTQALALFAASSFVGSMTILNCAFRNIRQRYKKMKPSSINKGKIFFMDAYTLLNMAMIMHLSALESIAMTGVFSGKSDLTEIVGDIDSSKFHTITTMQFLAMLTHAKYYNLDTQVILGMAVSIHDAVILKMGADAQLASPYATAALLSVVGLSRIGGVIKDKSLAVGGLITNRIISLPSVYTKIRARLESADRQQFDADVMDFAQRAITNTWTGSNAMMKRLMKYPQMSALIKTHHLNYI